MKTSTGEITLSHSEAVLENYYRLCNANSYIQHLLASDILHTWLESVVTNVYGGGLHYELFLNLDSRTVFYISSTKHCQHTTSSNIVCIAYYYNANAEEYEYSEEEYYTLREHIRENVQTAILEDLNCKRA